MKMTQYGCALLLLMAGCVTPSFAAELSGVSVQQKANEMLVKCQVQGAFGYNVFTLRNPNRVVVDLTDTRHMSRTMKKETRKGESPMLSKLRFGKPTANTLRVVFDVDRPMKVVQVTPKRGRENMGLTLELKPTA